MALVPPAPRKEIGVRDAKPAVPFIDEVTEANRRQGLEMTCHWSYIHSTNILCISQGCSNKAEEHVEVAQHSGSRIEGIMSSSTD